MKCYYELLELDRDCEADEIKKSYRKLALKWHPDKNPDKVEEATKYFSLLQQAYETLSDVQERSWYDRHREQILRGGFDGDYLDDSLDLIQYHCKCWQGFGDDEKGFFAVYRDVFNKLTAEDRDFHEDEGEANYPSFGNSKSDPQEVVSEFYGFWSTFYTVRSFTWLDKYDIRQAPSRDTARAMERENSKLREAGKKERNQQIRIVRCNMDESGTNSLQDLVNYIRKKDPRVDAYRLLLEKKKEEGKRRTEEMIRQRKIQNIVNAGEHKESEEVREAHKAALREIEQQWGGEGSEDDTVGEEEEFDDRIQVPYCIVCEKSFKTQATKENHERSKVHKKMLAELKAHMKEEDAEVLVDEEVEEVLGEVICVEGAEKGQRKSKKQKKKEAQRRRMHIEDQEEEEEEIDNLREGVSQLKVEGESANANSNSPSVVEAELLKEKKKNKEGSHVSSAEGNANHIEKTVSQGVTVPKPATCDKCGEFFESRSRLFSHLKESGHATPLPVAGSSKKSNLRKKAKK